MCEEPITSQKYKTCSCPVPDSVIWNTESCARYSESGVSTDLKVKHMGATTVRDACPRHGDEG